MRICVVTGSAGLIGAESARFFCGQGFRVLGIDNDMRRHFFGNEASTQWSRRALEADLPNYHHVDLDVRDRASVEKLFSEYGSQIELIIHTAGQPSHDWAAKDPHTDFSVNANGTLTLLEATRTYCPKAKFIFTSTNKVYGDTPNTLPLEELATRWELSESHPYFAHGINEEMSIDRTKHSLFGVSKLAADAMVQEYGRYFGMNTVCFRCGCLTGPGHAGTQLHGFLSYLVKCAVTKTKYTIFGYRGKQVRDNIHSADLVNMFWQYFLKPRPGEVYNAGGGRHSNCSLLEAIEKCNQRLNEPMQWEYTDQSRIGDHIWYVSDTRKFQSHYPDWRYNYNLDRILDELFTYSRLSTKRS